MSAAIPLEDAAGPLPRTAVSSRSIDELDTAICQLARELHAGTCRMLLLVREFDERFGWAKWSFRSCAEWLAWRCQISLSAAREKVRTAQALRELPEISAAFADGRLSYSKVRALTRVARPHNEDLLLAYALEATSPQVEERCRQMRNVEPAASDIARRIWERRSLSITRNPENGTLLISVELPAEDGELVVRALDRAVAMREVALGVDHVAAHGAERAASDGWRAQQADALVAVARAYVAGGAASADSGASSARTASAGSPAVADHYQIVVHVDEKSLRGGAGRSDLPLETVRRLSCDGNLMALIEDDRGKPLALGRKRRVVSAALRKVLFSRDRGCRFPGCHRRHYVDAHHIEHWAIGGATDTANLLLLCSYHHRLLHEGGFSVRGSGDGALEFRRADGRTIPASGYLPADMCDDEADDDGNDTEANAASRRENPSMEGLQTGMVREAAAVYRLHPA